MATQMELKVLFQAVSDTVHVTTFALRAPAGPAVLRVKMPLEVYLRAWIVTPFRGIFSIISILARSRSNQLRILSFIPFLFVF